MGTYVLGGRSVRYEIYVDRLFFLHFVMNFLLLYVTAVLSGRRMGAKRLLAAAAGGSAFFAAVMLLPLGGSVTAWLLKAGLQAAGTFGMLGIAFGMHSRENFIRTAFLYIAAACVLGGALGAIRGMRRGRSMGNILIPAAIAAAAAGWLVRKEQQRRENPVWKVWLQEGEKRVAVTALMDSGNSLYDPLSGKPVCIADQKVLEELGLLQSPEKFRLIPYHSIGKRHGLLQAAAVSKMYLQKEGQERKAEQVLIAASGQPLSSKGRYQMLLHPALLEEKKGENHDIESSNAGKDAV